MAEADDYLVIIFASSNYIEVQFVASLLDGNEVPAFVIDDNICRLFPQIALLVGGAKLLVKVDDVAPATEILEGVSNPDERIKGQCFPVPLSEPAILITAIRNWFRRRRVQQQESNNIPS